MVNCGDSVRAGDNLSAAADPGRIDLWRLSLDHIDPSPGEMFATLSPDEVQRALRFHFEKDRVRFAFVRRALRVILGQCLHLPPAHVEFCYGKNGKPSLAGTINPRGLNFNVSHSGGLALIAVAWGRELGVDIEQIRPDVNVGDIAAQFFSPREVAEIFSLPVEQRHIAFFNCWTRKEAYLKATGEGLSFPLRSFGVSLKPEDPARLIFVDGQPSELQRWKFQDVSPAPTHAAALAVEGGDSTITAAGRPLWIDYRLFC